MPLWPQFIGGAYKTRSGTFGNEKTVNLFLETSKSKANAKQAFLLGTPGRKPLTTVATLVCRGVFSQDLRTFTVIGDHFYEINTATGAITDYGAVTAGTTPVSMASNGVGGNQIAIVSTGDLRIFNLKTNVLSAVISTPLTNPAVIVAYIDTYFLLLEKNTVRVWFSALEDGTSWDGLDFFARSDSSDNIVGMIVAKNRVWVFGSVTSEVYYNTGAADNPFQPYPGTLMQTGATTAFAIGLVGDSVAWLAQDTQGRGRLVAAVGYSPTTISTPAIEFALNQCATLTDAELLVYEQEGHQFAIWTVPNGDITFGFDFVESEWHQRAGVDVTTGLDVRWRVRGLAQTPDGLLVGDYATGALCFLDLDTFTDNGLMIRRTRRSPYLSSENQWMFIEQFELGVQLGVGLPSGQGSDPTVELRLSRNNGNTWESAGPGSIGKIGAYDETGAIWCPLGRARSDRLVFEAVLTDPVRCAWGPGAWLRATPGTGQL